jgi:glycosyltransferase involved in cell wall biosynthesis
MPEVGLLLTPREPGGHESALLGWLADASREDGLQATVFAPTTALRQACSEAGLVCADIPWPDTATGQRLAALRVLQHWPRHRPLLLAPGVLHAAGWLLAAAVLLRHRVWVYVPNAHSAQRMGYRWAAARDRAITPWLRRVEAMITVDDGHALALREAWRVAAPVHCLPNLPRLPPAPAGKPAAPPGDGALRIAYVGRFDAHAKGLDWLAGLLRRCPAWAEPSRWLFQGHGPAETLLLELASALGPQRVQVQPHAPLDDALARCDVLVLPSRYEGVPLVALEATARGWPVVASRQAGVERLLPATSLFEFGDEAGLRDALASLQQAPARAAAVAHARAQRQALWPAARHQAARRAIVDAWRTPAGSAAC